MLLPAYYLIPAFFHIYGLQEPDLKILSSLLYNSEAPFQIDSFSTPKSANFSTTSLDIPSRNFVSIIPGEIPLIIIPFFSYSTDNVRSSPSKAYLVTV